MTRGEIWWADFGIPLGSETGFRRPVLIVQDDAFNESRIHTVVVIPCSTNLMLRHAPGNVFLRKERSALSKDSVLVVSQIAAIDKNRLIVKAGKVSRRMFNEVEEGIKKVLGME